MPRPTFRPSPSFEHRDETGTSDAEYASGTPRVPASAPVSVAHFRQIEMKHERRSGHGQEKETNEGRVAERRARHQSVVAELEEVSACASGAGAGTLAFPQGLAPTERSAIRARSRKRQRNRGRGSALLIRDGGLSRPPDSPDSLRDRGGPRQRHPRRCRGRPQHSHGRGGSACQ